MYYNIKRGRLDARSFSLLQKKQEEEDANPKPSKQLREEETNPKTLVSGAYTNTLIEESVSNNAEVKESDLPIADTSRP